MGARPADSASPAPRRALVAADEDATRFDLAEVLTEGGLTVVGSARDGHTAVAMSTALRPDIVVMDVAMPVMDGITASSRISAQPSCPVILLMSPSHAELVDEAVASGAMACLVKPFLPTSLLATTELVLARHAENVALLALALSLKGSLAEHQLVEQAKGLLMNHRQLTEAAAEEWLRNAAKGGNIRQAASDVIEQWSGRSRPVRTTGNAETARRPSVIPRMSAARGGLPGR